MKRRRFKLGTIVSLALGFAICTKAQAGDTNTVEYLRKACHESVLAQDNDHFRNRDGPFFLGFCFGAMGAMLMVYYDDIVKKGKAKECNYIHPNNGQLARVFLKYANEHPERLNEFFLDFAIEALRKAYPCP